MAQTVSWITQMITMTVNSVELMEDPDEMQIHIMSN